MKYYLCLAFDGEYFHVEAPAISLAKEQAIYFEAEVIEEVPENEVHNLQSIPTLEDDIGDYEGRQYECNRMDTGDRL